MASAGHTINLVDTPPNLVAMLRRLAEERPGDTAYIHLNDGEREEVTITYAELDRQARALAAWLESMDMAGQRAMLFYPPGLEFITAFFGCLYAKVIAVPVYPPRRNQLLDRLKAISLDSEAKVALTPRAVLDRVSSFTQQTDGLKELTWLATCEVPRGIEEHWEAPSVLPETLAFLQYTSGSTGSPKGVMLSHGNLIHNSALISSGFATPVAGSGVSWLPSYHDMGLIGGLLQPMYIGRPTVMMSPVAFLQKPVRWLSAISRYGATTAGGPNFAYDLCVRKVTPEQRETLDLSNWKVAFNGAEPVRSGTLEKFAETFASCGFQPEAFYPCYGLAEATLIVTGGSADQRPRIERFRTSSLAEGDAKIAGEDEQAVRSLVSSGSILADQEVAIVDPEATNRCVDGRIGEIWVKGPSVAQGYWRNVDATKNTFQAHLEDTGEGPFLRTGDLGFFHQGELFVTGRVKDMIIVHGQNHYPHDIEHTIEQCHSRLRPGCGAVFATEVKNREKRVAVYEVERGTNEDIEEIFANIRRTVSLAHDFNLDAIVLIRPGSIPKTSSGKIQRFACRDAWVDNSFSVVASWSAEEPEESVEDDAAAMAPPEIEARQMDETNVVAQAVFEAVRKVARHRAAGMTLDTVIAELGLDSLERVEILASLEERFAGRFPEEILPDLHTARQVVDAVEKYLGREPRKLETLSGSAEIPSEYYQIDEFPETIQMNQTIDMLVSMGLENPYFRVHQSVLGSTTVIDGRELINYSSFNYIGMSGHPDVAAASKRAIEQYGTSGSASRLVSGEKDIHVELEQETARFLGTEDAISFCTGHATNESVIGHLFGPGDLIVHDGLAHNSIVQGSILSGARRRPFPHNDFEALNDILEQYRYEYRRVLIAIESVYSMDGDIANLPEFIAVKKRHKALLLIDEAHSIGVLGKTGRGIGEMYDVDRNDVELWMGTYSKGLGSCGGYVAGTKGLIHYLKYTTPAFVFSTSQAPASTAASLEALRVLQREPERVARLAERSKLFLTLAKERGMNTGYSKGTPVVPVILGNSVHALKISETMAQRGINVQPILYPAVEESAARLRFFIHSEHTEDQIRYTVNALAEEMEKLECL